jgi:hypothetical protein
MSFGDKTKAGLEKWFTKRETPDKPSWSDRIKDWAANVISWGIEVIMDVIAKKASAKLQPLIASMEKTGKVPPELKPLLDELAKPSGEVGALLAQSASSSLLGNAIGSIVDAFMRPLTYRINSLDPTLEANPPQAIVLWLRGEITEENCIGLLRNVGYRDSLAKLVMNLAKIRLDPQAWIIAKRRQYGSFDKVKDDLKHQGWDDDRIAALEFVTQIIPNVQDLIRFGVREVYTPEIAEKFGQFEDFPEKILDDASKVGILKEWIMKYWAAHWDLPGANYGFEMLHRAIITEDELKLLLRALDVMPFWRDRLIKMSWNVPTRVDVRRMWAMGTIDEPRLREIYTALGYHEKDLEDYVLWTKVYVALPDLIARWKNGWISDSDVYSSLIELGVPEERANTIMETKVKVAEPERLIKEKDLTAAEIIKGVKKGVISEAEGRELLVDMGYSEEEADFKIAIEVAVLAGSPETYSEFKDITQRFLKALGKDAKVLPPELIAAETALKEAESKLKELQDKGVKPDKLLSYQKTKDDAAYRYRQLLIQWKEKSKKS